MKKDNVIEFVHNAAKEFLAPEIFILFGSRARGDFHEKSDYDFAILPHKDNVSNWSQFTDKVREAAPTLKNIDLVNLSDPIDDKFSKRIFEEGIRL